MILSSEIQTIPLNQIKYLFTDVDDTLTTNGALLPETLEAMYRLKAQGITVVPVTGACAGWCDQMLRLWPIDTVIGENGAFAMHLNTNQSITTDFWDGAGTNKENQARVKSIIEKYIKNHDTFFFSADQPYRLCDVAIDIAQSNTSVDSAQIQNLIAHLKRFGVNARQSSIHVNAWLGDFDKFSMVKRVLHSKFKLPESEIQTKVAYIGDAPNDEPMFKGLTHTFGVANIRRHLSSMSYHPWSILSKEGGLGFVECTNLLLKNH